MSDQRPPRPVTVTPRPLAELATRRVSLEPVPVSASGTVDTPAEVTGITHDSRMVGPGDVYAALPGSRTHGAAFVEQAAAAGAVAVLTDAEGLPAARGAGLPALLADDARGALGEVAAAVYGDPSAHLTVIGTTGTTGKTTCSYLVEAGLRAAGHTTGLLGTVETRIAGTAVPSVRTTPEAPDLQALLAVMVERGVSAVAMEVSSHALALGRAEGTRFTVGAFTNLGLDHLDFHADLEDYFAAKARLFDGRCEHEVVNLDDPTGRRLLRDGTITVSTGGPDEPPDPEATWRAGDVRADPSGFGQLFTAYGPGGLRLDGAVRMPGSYSVGNALLALAACVAAGADPEAATAGIAGCGGVPGRLERVSPDDSPVLGVVDYAHKPDAVAAVLAALRPLTRGRLICVLGAGGDRDAGKRPLMGEAAARGADTVVVTDDNPRSEDPAAVRAGVLAGARGVAEGERGDVVEVAGRSAAVTEAVRMARPGDAVAVLGKGHEQGQEVAGVVHPFDDRVVLRDALGSARDSSGAAT